MKRNAVADLPPCGVEADRDDAERLALVLPGEEVPLAPMRQMILRDRGDILLGRSYVGLERGHCYRQKPGSAKTNEWQSTVLIPSPLLVHLRRWRRIARNSAGFQSPRQAVSPNSGELRILAIEAADDALVGYSDHSYDAGKPLNVLFTRAAEQRPPDRT